MGRYLVRRLGQTALVLLLLSVVVFVISRLSGSPVSLMLPEGASDEQRDQLVAKLGLDESYPQQYWTFLVNALQGDFGQSTRFQTAALPLVLDRLPNTIVLASTALVVAVLVGIPLGTLAALHHGRATDHVTTTLLATGQAAPSFWVGILLILVFGVQLQWLPFSDFESWRSLVLPALTLSILPTVTIARVTRSSVLGVLPEDYVRTARAKGLRRRAVVRGHVMRNALIPVVTIVGLVLGSALSGAVITEQIFSWPGVGALAIEAIKARDYAVVQAVTMITALIVVVLNLVVDLSYFLLDPRIRRTGGRAAA
ncbi:MAG: ABC transporter permease [Nocardioidaceae bacterium]